MHIDNIFKLSTMCQNANLCCYQYLFSKDLTTPKFPSRNYCINLWPKPQQRSKRARAANVASGAPFYFFLFLPKQNSFTSHRLPFAFVTSL